MKPFTIFAFMFVLIIDVEADCPDNLPTEIDGDCYRFYKDQPSPYNNAKSNCRNLGEGAKLAKIKNNNVLEKMADDIRNYADSYAMETRYWLGFLMTDKDTFGKSASERTWTSLFDDTEIKQKDFTMWHEEPSSQASTCSVADGTKDFKVVAVSCGEKFAVICRKKDAPCKRSNAHYLSYGDRCLNVINTEMKSKDASESCDPEKMTPLMNEDDRAAVTRASRNSFLGGAVYVDIKKQSDGKFAYSDGSEPEKELWESGEPRDDYDCVGLSLQDDGLLKLKVISCSVYAHSLCFIDSLFKLIEDSDIE